MPASVSLYLKNELARANEHACAARQIVAEQELRIARMNAAGHPTFSSERILELLAESLKLLEDNERELRSEAAALEKLEVKLSRLI
ncbi:MAG: hypothetical protein J2P49_00355 [Methylocapsa sp.]|nr:hypothetical protein [Methylocapsa sp.]